MRTSFRMCAAGVVIVAASTAALIPLHSQEPETKQAGGDVSFPVSLIEQGYNVPADLNPDGGGAPKANLEQAAVFAWQEFIALSWPAVQQTGMLNTRDVADQNKPFGDPNDTGPLVWETYRAKVEIYPGTGYYDGTTPPSEPPGYPPGYVNDPAQSFGYDAPPKYVYNPTKVNTPDGTIPACDTAQKNDPVPWVNLDEVNQIGLDTMYVGLPVDNPGANSDPQRIRFLAKANRTEYTYAAQNNYWWESQAFKTAQTNLQTGISNETYPTAPFISFPAGTIEVKAAWRPLSKSQNPSHFHTTTVRYYETNSDGSPCYHDETWGLIGLHIIHKTPTAPYFIFATFEQAENLLTPTGAPVEDNNGKVVRLQTTSPTTPALTYQDSPTVPKVSIVGDTYCEDPKDLLYYKNNPQDDGLPSNGNICVNNRYHAIPPTVIAVNKAAHQALTTYSSAHNLGESPWQHYKLVNVQWVPFDLKEIDLRNPDSNKNASTFYQANIVVETNYTLQEFSGRISTAYTPPPTLDQLTGAPTNYTTSGEPGFLNTFIVPIQSTPGKIQGVNMGGCMGCHGNAQVAGSDFSFILANPVTAPETPTTDPAASFLRRYQSLIRR